MVGLMVGLGILHRARSPVTFFFFVLRWHVTHRSFALNAPSAGSRESRLRWLLCAFSVSQWAKVITHPAFIICILTGNPNGPDLLVRVVQTAGRIPPACPVFLLHTALITVGVSSLTACGARSVHRPRGLRGAPNGRRAPHTPSSPSTGRTHSQETGQRGRSHRKMSPGIITPRCTLRTCLCLENKHWQVWQGGPVIKRGRPSGGGPGSSPPATSCCLPVSVSLGISGMGDFSSIWNVQKKKKKDKWINFFR